jgi:hypothetical protein
MFLEDFDTHELFLRFSRFYVLRYQSSLISCISFVFHCSLHKPVFILKLISCTMQWIDQLCGFPHYLSLMKGQSTERC